MKLNKSTKHIFIGLKLEHWRAGRGNSSKIVVQKLFGLAGPYFHSLPDPLDTSTVSRIENRPLSKREACLPLKGNVKKGWRESIPLEELQSDHETRFLADEHRAFNRTMRDNSSYV